MWTPNRRVVAAAIAASLLGLGLAVGAGVATAGTCNDEAFGVGPGQDLGVTLLDAGPVGVFAGVDNDLNESGDGFNTVTACAGAPDDAEPHADITLVSAGDPSNNPAPGVVVDGPNGWTGAEVGTPELAVNQPGDGYAGIAVLKSYNTCIHRDGDSSWCHQTGTLAGLSVAEYDDPDSNIEQDCVEVNGECQTPPLPTGVAYQHGNDLPSPTLGVTVNGTTQTVDIPHACVEFGAECP